MLETLVASHPHRQGSPAALFGAALLHATLLSLGIVTTGVTVQAVARAVDDTTLIYLPRLDPVQTQEPSHPGVPGGGGSGAGGSGIVMAVNPPALGFQVVDLVTAVPTSIPGIDAAARAIDPRDYTGRGAEGGAAWGVIGGTGAADQPRPPEGSGGIVYAMSLIDDRFTPAEMLVPPTLIYPPALKEAGIAGNATVQFIIDTAGVIEEPSITVISASREAFGVAAREGLREVRFSPALFGGRPVRQLSRLPVKFALRAKA